MTIKEKLQKLELMRQEAEKPVISLHYRKRAQATRTTRVVSRAR